MPPTLVVFWPGGLDVFFYVEEYPRDPNKVPVLRYNGDFAFDPFFPTDPAFSRTGDDCTANPAILGCTGPGEINGVAFGSSTGLAAGGPTLVGSLSFTGVNLGYAVVHIGDNDFPTGSWFNTAGEALVVNYDSASVNVIPIPAAVWLFGTGLLGLIGVVRRRK